MKKNIEVFTIDSFSKTGEASTGNPAGFVLWDLTADSAADWLNEEEMRAVAEAVGFSETAFVSPCDAADYQVRFFTPNEEVDLCGHATIGLFSGLYQLGRLKPGSYTQQTKAGRLQVKVSNDGQILMEQAKPHLGAVYKPEQVAASLGLSSEAIRTDMPCQAVSTGLLDLMIPLRTVADLEAIQADDQAITDISRAFGVVGYHVFAEVSAGESAVTQLRCRNFAPLYAIPEEAATGTSNGALLAYLNAHGQAIEDSVQTLQPTKAIQVIQGVEMGRPSQINAEMDSSGTVWVGGYACHLDKKLAVIDQGRVTL